MNRLVSIKSVLVSLSIITVTACGGGGGGIPAPVNRAPVALAQSVSTEENIGLDIVITGTDADGDVLSYMIVDTTEHGELSGVVPNLSYSPDEDFIGNDSFTFTVNDGVLTSSEAIVSISVGTVDLIPDVFTFADKSNVVPNVVISSDTISITGINVATTVTISNGEYSINGGAFTMNEGVISNNQSIAVRLTSSSVALESVETIVTIGGVENIFKVTTSVDIIAPTIDIVFPSTKIMTTNSSMVVRGTTVDEGTIDSVTVNDIEVVSNDDFANWTVSIPLQAGTNEITVVATDLVGNSNTVIPLVSIDSRPVFINKTALQFNSVSNRLVFFNDDDNYDGDKGLYDFDFTSQNFRLISSDDFPNMDNQLGTLSKFIITEDTNSAFGLTYSTFDPVFKIDLASGERTRITVDTEALPSHTLLLPTLIELDEAENVAYVLDGVNGRRAILKFDLETGEGTVFVEDYAIGRYEGMVLDKANNRLLLTGPGQNNILAINLDTGNETNLWNENNTISMLNSKSITLDAANNRALMFDTVLGIIAITLDTGVMTIVQGTLDVIINKYSTMDMVYDGANGNNRVFIGSASGDVVEIDLSTGNESILSTILYAAIYGLTLDSTNTNLLVADSRGLHKVNLSTGENTVVSDSVTPNAINSFGFPADVGILSDNRTYVIDSRNDSLMRVDLTDGARSIVSDKSSIDANNTFYNLSAIAVDEANSRSVVLDYGRKALLSVDNNSGERAVISDLVTPNAENPFESPTSVIIEGGRALVSDYSSNSILSVDLTSGLRSIFSASGTPDNTNPLEEPRKMVLDSDNKRILVVDANGVMAISLADGVRTILSGKTIPDSNYTFERLNDITLDSSQQRAIVFDAGLQRVLAIDLGTGERKPVMDGFPNIEVPFLYHPSKIVLDDTGDSVTLFVGDTTVDSENTSNYEGHEGLLKINLNTGVREKITLDGFPQVRDFAIDALSNTVYMVDAETLYRENLETHARTIISGADIPDNTNPLVKIDGMALDLDKKIAYVSDLNQLQIIAIDLNTGKRTIISSNSFPDTSIPFSAKKMILDKDRLLVINQGQILTVDIASGERTVFSVEDGENNSLNNPTDMVLDKANNRLLVIDVNSISSVDLTTGIIQKFVGVHFEETTSMIVRTMGISLTPVDNQVLVTSPDYGVISVDLITGEQAIISR